MKPKLRLEIDKSDHGEFYARAVMKNGEEVWRTSETYSRKENARKAIDALVYTVTSEDFEIVDLTKSVVSHKRK